MKNDTECPEMRDAYKKAINYIDSEKGRSGRVCVIYGLKKTGRNKILKQLYEHYGSNESLYLRGADFSSMEELYDKLEPYRWPEKHKGLPIIKYVFIENITDIDDFIEMSAVLADAEATSFYTVTVTGDNVCIDHAEERALFDRTHYIHTTFMTYDEYNRLHPGSDFDGYIKNCFAVNMGSREYINEAIGKNILHSYANDDKKDPYFREKPKFMNGMSDETFLNLVYNVLKLLVIDTNASFYGYRLFKSYSFEDKKELETLADYFKQRISGIEHMTYYDFKRLFELLHISGILTEKNYQDNQFEADYRICQRKTRITVSIPSLRYKIITEIGAGDTYADIFKDCLMTNIEAAIKAETFKPYDENERYEVSNYNFTEKHAHLDTMVYDHNLQMFYGFEMLDTDKMPSLKTEELLCMSCGTAIGFHGHEKFAAILYLGKSEDLRYGIWYFNITEFLNSLFQAHDLEVTIKELTKKDWAYLDY